jgi:hypothetical protein
MGGEATPCNGDVAGACAPAQNQVQVQAAVTEQAEIVQNKKLPDGSSVIGVGGTVTDTITVNGKALSNAKVTESNVNTLFVDGKEMNNNTKQGPGSTNNAGQLGDSVGLYQPAGTASQDANLVRALSTHSVDYTNTNTITFAVPGGATYSATSTRTVTNEGHPSTYTLSTSQPIVRVVPP